MTFANPAFVLLALALCVAVVFALRALERRRSGQMLAYSSLAFLQNAASARSLPLWILPAAVGLSTFLLGCALAGPHVVAMLPAKDGSVVLCIDTSGSMTATDVLPSRAQAANAAARAFIGQTPPGTRIGIVSFASSAQVVQPLTRDPQAAVDALDRIPFPNGGTAIGDALAQATQLLGVHGHRVIILITDGVNNVGADPLQVADVAASKHVPIYTIGIGSNDSGELIPGTNEPATLDEDALRAIAAAGGGAYARAGDSPQLQAALSQLGRTTILEKRRIDATLPFAFTGGFLLVLTMLGGMAAGRFP